MTLRCPELVGREWELTRLAEMIGLASDGRADVLALVGPAGIGKSALARQAEELVRDVDGTVLVGRCSARSPVPFRVLAELALAALARGADPESVDLGLYRPALNLLVGDLVEPASSDPGPTVALACGEAILRLAAALPPPVVMVLEDLHWADPDSLVAVELLCDHAVSRDVSLIATVRSDEPSDAGGLVGALVERRAATALQLAPLDRAAVEEMVALCTGETPQPAVVDAIELRAEGRPLIVEELLGALQGRPGDDPSAVSLPMTLLDSVRQRLRRLVPDTEALVILAAQIGPEVDLELLGAAGPLGEADLDRALATAEAELLIETVGDRARFRHGLTRSAILEATPGPNRRRIAAAALDRLGDLDHLVGGDLEAAAALADHAGRTELAARLAVAAGRTALAHGALESAHGWLTSARELAVDRFDTRAEATALLVEVLAHRGQVEAARDVGSEALQMAGVRADGEARDRIRLALIRADVGAEQWESATEQLAGVEATDDAGELLILRARVALGEGDHGRAVELAQRARRVADVAAEPAVACEALEVLGRSARASDLETAARWFQEAVAVSERAGLGAWRARALHELSTIRQLDQGDVSGHEQALEAAIDAGALGLAAAVLFHLGAVHGVQFNSEVALSEGRQGLDLARRLGAVRQEAMAWIIIGQAHASAGRVAQARAAAGEAVALVPGDPEIAGLAGGACVGLSLIVNEQRDEALDAVRDAVTALDRLPARTPVSSWYLWPVLEAVAGADAAGALETTDTPELRIARGFDGLWRLAAAIEAGKRADVERADSFLADALTQFDRCPGFAGYRHLGLRLAAESAIDDRWGEPARWLSDGETWFADRGLTRLAQAARSLAGRTGARGARRGGPPVPEGLARFGVTSRELDVLSLLGEGLTNKEIGERLYISPRTVKSHVEHLLTKTGAGNRAQLAATAAPHLAETDDR